MVSNYAIARVQRRVQGQKPAHIEDPVFRSNIVSLAATGMSRRGVAMAMGISPQTLLNNLERGRAHPEVEPYGSFTMDYLRAERGLELAAAGTITLVVQRLYLLARTASWAELAECGPQLKELLNVLASRYPKDWGNHAHREPEPDPDGEAWLERSGATHAQLVHAFREPPEEIRLALVEAAPEVFALLVAAGFKVPT